jgi:hypothetical protein
MNNTSSGDVKNHDFIEVGLAINIHYKVLFTGVLAKATALTVLQNINKFVINQPIDRVNNILDA